MLDLIAIALFMFFLVTTPSIPVFLFCVVGIWMSLNWTLYMVFRLPHRQRKRTCK